MNPTLIIYVVLGSVLAVLHFLLGDAGGFLSPTVKGVLSMAALAIAAFLPSLQGSLAAAAKKTTLPVLLAFCLGGCAWFSANKQALEPLEVDACVFGALEAGMSSDAAAAFCKVTVDYVNSLAAKKAQYKRAAQGDAGAK